VPSVVAMRTFLLSKARESAGIAGAAWWAETDARRETPVPDGFQSNRQLDRFDLVKWGTVTSGDWSSTPVWIAKTFRQRWKGLTPTSDGHGMLMKGRSVHGFGMREPLLAVGLDDQTRVVGFRVLFPRRVVWIRGATRILELPVGAMPPPHGAVLTWERGGSPDSVRNPDRQPG
jgi:hypothetical protein